MKNIFRLLILFLFVSGCRAMIPVEFEQKQHLKISSSQPFVDLVDDPTIEKYLKYIWVVYEEGVWRGCDLEADPNARFADLEYCPHKKITKLEAAKMVMSAMIKTGMTPPLALSSTPYWEDVPRTHLYFNELQKVWEEGIAGGAQRKTETQSRVFGSDQNQLRGWVAAFIARSRAPNIVPKEDSSDEYEQAVSPQVPEVRLLGCEFSDLSQDSKPEPGDGVHFQNFFWYYQYFCGLKISNGCGLDLTDTEEDPGKFCESQTVEAWEMATIIARVYFGME